MSRFPSLPLLAALALAVLLTAQPALAQQKIFDPNIITCSEVMRGGDDLMELTTLFTYAFLSGLDFSQGLPVAALDQETFASTQNAVENLCARYPEHTILGMITAGLEGKPQ